DGNEIQRVVAFCLAVLIRRRKPQYARKFRSIAGSRLISLAAHIENDDAIWPKEAVRYDQRSALTRTRRTDDEAAHVIAIDPELFAAEQHGLEQPASARTTLREAAWNLDQAAADPADEHAARARKAKR